MKVKCKATLEVKHNTTAAELRLLLDKVPDTAKVSIDYYRGDQRDPGYTYLNLSWTEER